MIDRKGVITICDVKISKIFSKDKNYYKIVCHDIKLMYCMACLS